MKRVAILLLSLISTSQAFHLVIVGSGALEVQLMTAKLAHKQGDTATLVVGTDINTKTCQKMMYGSEDLVEGVSMVSSGSDIGEALDKVDGLVLICDVDRNMDWDVAETLLDNANADTLRHVALLSQMGGKSKQLEEKLRKRCQEDDQLCLSIIRAGILKGGGAGQDPETPFGLHKYWYDTLFELKTALLTMSFDKYTLGATVTEGDTPCANFFQKMSSGQSFDPAAYDTGRLAAAQALLTAVHQDKNLDVSIGTASAKEPPTMEEWKTMLNV